MLAIETHSDRMTDTHIMRFVGDADLQALPNIERATRELLARRPHSVVIDLSGVRFMSSVAVGLIVEFHRALEAARSHLDLASPRPDLAAFLRFTHLDTVLNVYDTLNDALAVVVTPR